MEITKTDQKWINRLFELKPDATGKDVMKLINRLATTDMRRSVHWRIEKEIADIIKEEEK